jgi:hypothetical protein
MCASSMSCANDGTAQHRQRHSKAESNGLAETIFHPHPDA